MVEFCCHDYYFRAIVNAVVDEYLSGDKEKNNQVLNNACLDGLKEK